MCGITGLLFGAGQVINALGTKQAIDAKENEAQAHLQEGSIAKTFADLQAGVLDTNAQVTNAGADLTDRQAEIAGMGAALAYAKGRKAEGDIRYAGRQTLATQRNTYASNNLDPAYGSPLLHEALTASQVETDVGIVRSNAGLEAADALSRAGNLSIGAIGQRIAASGITLQSDITRFQGKAAQLGATNQAIASMYGAGTAFLSGVGRGIESTNSYVMAMAKAASGGGGGGG